MKTNSDKLYDLVGNMSKAEKGYFKKWKSGFSNTSALTEVFDTISNNPGKDESEILKKIKSPSVKKFFASKKYELFNELVDSLTIMKLKDKSTIWKLRTAIAKGTILSEKNQFTEALKVLDKAAELALEEYQYDYAIIILNLKVILVQEHMGSSNTTRLDLSYETRLRIVEASKQNLNKHEYYLGQDFLLKTLFEYNSTYSLESRDRAQQAILQPLWTNEATATNPVSRCLFHFLNYRIQKSFYNDFERSAKHLKQAIEINALNENSIFMLKEQFVTLSCMLGDLTNAKLMLDEMSAENELNNESMNSIFTHAQAVYLTAVGDLDKAREIVVHFKINHSESLEKSVSINSFVEVKFYEILIELLSCNYKAVIKLCSEFQYETAKNNIPQIELGFRAMKLIAIAGKEDDYLFESELNSSMRYVRNHETSQFYKIIFKTIKNIYDAPDSDSKRRIHLEFDKQIRPHIRAYQLSLMFGYMKFDKWLESTYSNEPFSQLYALKVNVNIMEPS